MKASYDAFLQVLTLSEVPPDLWVVMITREIKVLTQIDLEVQDLRPEGGSIRFRCPTQELAELILEQLTSRFQPEGIDLKVLGKRQLPLTGYHNYDIRVYYLWYLFPDGFNPRMSPGFDPDEFIQGPLTRAQQLEVESCVRMQFTRRRFKEQSRD